MTTRINNILLSFFCIFFLSNCGTKNSKKVRGEKLAHTNISHINDTIILHSLSDQPLSFYYLTLLKASGPVFFLKGETKKLYSDKPIYFIEPSPNQVPYILYPGDSINIIAGDNKRPVFTTADNTRNNELNFFSQLCQKYGMIRPVFNTTFLKNKITLKQRDSLIEELYKKRLLFLNNYAKTNDIRNTFKNLAKKIIEYSRLYLKVSLYYKGFDKNKLYSFYKDSIEKYMAYFSCDTCLDNTVYSGALKNLIRLQLPVKNSKMPMVFFGHLTSNALDSAARLVENKLKGRAQDFILAQIIKERMFVLAKSNSLKSLPNLIYHIRDTSFVTSLKQMFYKLNSNFATSSLIPEKQILYAKKTKDSLSFGKLIEQNKLLLIDFWATWCKPCMMELPYSKALLNQYPKNKFNVIFISLDRDKEKWEKFENKNIPDDNSYLLKGGFASPLVKKYIHNGIPHYMLINKNGKIISSDAPRPSDKALQKLIEKNL